MKNKRHHGFESKSLCVAPTAADKVCRFGKVIHSMVGLSDFALCLGPETGRDIVKPGVCAGKEQDAVAAGLCPSD